MKYLRTIALATLASTLFVDGAEKGQHLFILSGQSNMEGLKPGISFTPALTKEFGEDSVIVVKYAVGGQSIQRWYRKWQPARKPRNPGNLPPNGDLYDRLMARVNEAIEGKEIETVTFVWMQGERDGNVKRGDEYEVSLKGVIEQIRTDMGRRDVNFVIGRISDYGSGREHWDKVREAQVRVAEADPRGAWVDTDDLNDGTRAGKEIKNDLHYTSDGRRILGERFALTAIALLKR
jgi:hypothetical protein